MANEKNLPPNSGNEANIEFTWGRYLFFAALTLILCSFPGGLFLAPIPIAMMMLLFGFQRGISLGLGAVVLLLVLNPFLPLPGQGLNSAVMAGFSTMLAIGIHEIVRRKEHPSKGLLVGAPLLFGILLFVYGALSLTTGKTARMVVEENMAVLVKEFNKEENKKKIKNAPEESAIFFEDFTKNTQKYVDEIVAKVLPISFAAVVVSFWISLFIVLKNGRIWQAKNAYPFKLEDLIKFKTPGLFVYPLIAGLALKLIGDKTFGVTGVMLGDNVLIMLGVFYVIQGFGVFLDFLTHIKILGFFRIIFVLLAVFKGLPALGIIGVLDFWVDFRKFFKKNEENEGDSL